MGEASQNVTVVNRKGLHARASSQLMVLATGMEGCNVTVSKDGISASGKSLLDLLMLGAGQGSVIGLRVEGEEAEARLAQLVALVESGFGED